MNRTVAFRNIQKSSISALSTECKMVIVDRSMILRQQLHGLLVGAGEHAVGEEGHQVLVGTAGLLLLGGARVDEGGAGGVEHY